MPEKIEIALMAESLNKRFKDKILHTLIITPKSRYYSKPIKGYDIESWIPLQEKIIIPFFCLANAFAHSKPTPFEEPVIRKTLSDIFINYILS